MKKSHLCLGTSLTIVTGFFLGATLWSTPAHADPVIVEPPPLCETVTWENEAFCCSEDRIYNRPYYPINTCCRLDPTNPLCAGFGYQWCYVQTESAPPTSPATCNDICMPMQNCTLVTDGHDKMVPYGTDWSSCYAANHSNDPYLCE